LYPDLRQKARENRLFLAAAVRWLAAECGIRQYLDLGSGLPAGGSNTHEVVHAVSPACGVAYVDIDPVAVAHADALLATSKRVQAVRGDLADPLAPVIVRRYAGGRQRGAREAGSACGPRTP
jgi:S-adenosyl methyltransferase